MFLAVFAGKARPATAAKKGARDVADVDEDTAESYSQKVGRWARETLVIIRTDAFWGSLALAFTSRMPVDEMHCWLQKLPKPGDPPKWYL